MYTLVRRAGTRDWLITEGPSLLTSVFVAELFYKFHSFTLECAAFLVTWLAISSLVAFSANMLWPEKRVVT